MSKKTVNVDLSTIELYVLLLKHREKEREAAENQDYPLAQKHKERADHLGNLIASANAEVAVVLDTRPVNCRNRQRDEGKPYPRSGCEYCHTGGITGCPEDR